MGEGEGETELEREREPGLEGVGVRQKVGEVEEDREALEDLEEV